MLQHFCYFTGFSCLSWSSVQLLLEVKSEFITFCFMFKCFVFNLVNKNITAESGQDVILTCRAANNNNIFVEWRRVDLDEYVLLYGDEGSVLEDQHPSFKNRVDLQDRQMKDGDVSLILKNVMIADSGTYECRVIQRGHSHKKTVIKNKPICIMDLSINITAESGQNITLPCRAHNNQKPIIVVEWIRSDLGAGYALLFQDGHFVPDHQHPFFKNRVDLQDRQKKDGDVSLILNNVTPADSGTYECHVVTRGILPRGELLQLFLIKKQAINTTAGQTAILPCQVPNLNSDRSVVIEWSRTDLGAEHVFFYQDQKFIPDDQHSSFKNRVDLQDRQMKHGDVSLILNNVTINDTGTYMCCVFMKGAKHRRRAKLDSDLISVVNLRVVPSGE
uniref:Ig-like domain-containing protein n=1 Tax=Maylandia zebra TaxID=106582 RepID=A0A3P9CF37_9CICH